jgi:hypothetical protein
LVADCSAFQSAPTTSSGIAARPTFGRFAFGIESPPKGHKSGKRINGLLGGSPMSAVSATRAEKQRKAQQNRPLFDCRTSAVKSFWP